MYDKYTRLIQIVASYIHEIIMNLLFFNIVHINICFAHIFILFKALL